MGRITRRLKGNCVRVVRAPARLSAGPSGPWKPTVCPLSYGQFGERIWKSVVNSMAGQCQDSLSIAARRMGWAGLPLNGRTSGVCDTISAPVKMVAMHMLCCRSAKGGSALLFGAGEMIGLGGVTPLAKRVPWVNDGWSDVIFCPTPHIASARRQPIGRRSLP